MMGLVIYGVFLVYLAVSVGLVMAAAKAAKKRNIARWKFALPVGLVMYLLVFWDHIPTVVAHKYYCDKYAGLTVYKTVEQWKAENPGVAENIGFRAIPSDALPYAGQSGYKLGDGTYGYRGSDGSLSYNIPNGVSGYWLNDRIVWEKQEESSSLLPITITSYSIKDTVTNQTLLKSVNVGSGYGNLSKGSTSSDWQVMKFWVGSDTCGPRLGEGIEPYKKMGRKG